MAQALRLGPPGRRTAPGACCSTTAVTDAQQHSFVLDLESGGQSGPGLYRAGCTCGGWIYSHLVQARTPRAQAAFNSWVDEHFMPLHQK